MKTATIRDLRNHFPQVASWIEQGESVEITRGGKLFARLTPAKARSSAKFRMPNIMERLNQTFPGREYDSEDLDKGLELSRGEQA